MAPVTVALGLLIVYIRDRKKGSFRFCFVFAVAYGLGFRVPLVFVFFTVASTEGSFHEIDSGPFKGALKRPTGVGSSGAAPRRPWRWVFGALPWCASRRHRGLRADDFGGGFRAWGELGV